MDEQPQGTQVPVPLDANEDGIQKLLERLVPEAGRQVEFRDLTGALHRTPAVRSLRIQAQVATAVRDIVGHVGDLELSAAGMLAAIANPEALQAFVRMFEVLHPAAVRRAAENVRSMDAGQRLAIGIADDMLTSLGVVDLFSAEELVDAIAPFCAGPLLKLLRMVPTTGG